MVVYDVNGNKLESYDLGTGYLVDEYKSVYHIWVSDQDSGRWITRYADDDSVCVDFDRDIPDGLNKEDGFKNYDVFGFCVFRELTEEEKKLLEDKRAEDEIEKRSTAQILVLAKMQVAAMSFVDETDTAVANVNALLPEWVPDGHQYKQRDAFQLNGRTWRVSQDTVSQSIYPPDVSESIYYEIVIAADGVIVYRQCHGSYDAVMKGELRHYPDADGPVYRSLIDDNAYAPDVVPANWELVG